MGITGLLPFLEKASEKIHIESLANRTVAIDSYCWLHKGAFAVADKLARGEATDVHISYCLKYVNMLLSYNIKPILVFDGRHLPAKADTEAKRRELRKNAKQMAIELMRKGKHSEARNYLRRCVDVTHEMALQLIQACRQINVDCIVAPYEADGQLAYLCKIGIADCVITEDSDLVLFGCQQILFKMDLFGNGNLVDATKLHLAMGCREDKFTMEKFRFMCILSGCDYVDSLPGIGLAKACKFMLKTEETDMMRALDKIPAYLNMRQLTVTEEYKLSVLKADATFQHMVVYDPLQRKQVRLYDPNETGIDIELCCNAGVLLDDDTALNLAVGNLNPFSMKKLDNWHPDRREKGKGHKTGSWKHLTVAKHQSIWQKGWKSQTNGLQQTTLLKTMSQSQPLPIRPKTSLPLPFIESDVDDEAMAQEDAKNAENLLNEYTNERNQPSKKFKAEMDDIEMEDEIKPDDFLCSSSPTKTFPSNRNPFKKEPNVMGDFHSPTKITSANSSLIKNQSPIKQINFNRLEKLSRFSRTEISHKQNVISRFFTGSQGNATNQLFATKNSASVQMEMEEKTIDQEVLKQETDGVVKFLYSSTSGDNTISLGIENESSEVYDTANDDDKTDDINKKTDMIGNPNDVAIEISDNEETKDEVPLSQLKCEAKSAQIRNVNSKNGSRKPGLSLKNSKKRTTKASTADSTTIQSKLSMFGFQKRPQAL